ncbi:sugar-binding domain-containing protein [Cryobacterium sp. MDB2-A-1]|uniref:sugar-binding domain-containing protein n=1 Tax=unclassified Cryobacterium TaxID=2649013 RepID=UPI0035143B6E
MTITNDPSLSGRTDDALTAAQPYYVQDHLTMEAIAHELHTFRLLVSRLLRQARANGLVDIQIRSPLNATSRLDYTSEILRRFGDAFGAHVEQFPVQTFFDDPATKRAFWRERGVTRLLEMQARINVALFGLGSPFSKVPSHVYARGYFEDEDFTALSAAGVVGVVGDDDVAPSSSAPTGPSTGSRSTSAVPGQISPCCAGRPGACVARTALPDEATRHPPQKSLDINKNIHSAGRDQPPRVHSDRIALQVLGVLRSTERKPDRFAHGSE